MGLRFLLSLGFCLLGMGLRRSKDEQAEHDYETNQFSHTPSPNVQRVDYGCVAHVTTPSPKNQSGAA
jgi:hypothetical protein